MTVPQHIAGLFLLSGSKIHIDQYLIFSVSFLKKNLIGLDGGYVIFLLFEILSGRKVSDKVMETANTVGLVLLLGLMLYANGLDIFRLFQN